MNFESKIKNLFQSKNNHESVKFDEVLIYDNFKDTHR